MGPTTKVFNILKRFLKTVFLCTDSDSAFQFDESYPWPYEIEGLDQHDIEEDLFDGVEPMMKYASVPAVLWSKEDVVSFIRFVVILICEIIWQDDSIQPCQNVFIGLKIHYE